MRPKARLAAELLRKRLEHADHQLRKLPGERQLADELGLSRNTIRAALNLLVKDGVMSRAANGRIAIRGARRPDRQAKTIGFLAPSIFSMDYHLWFDGVTTALKGREATLRPLTYAHWGDPVIHQALNGLDGLFFIPPAEAVPGWLAAKMREAACRAVILDADESPAGLPSVVAFPARAVEKLLKHLCDLGHTRIDCLNTQAEDSVIRARIQVWREFLDRHGLFGELRSMTVSRPVASAYEIVRAALRSNRALAAAQLCTTGPAAIGAMRAFHEAGLEAGRDVSICAVNDEGMAPYQLKTLTALVSPPRAEYLRGAVRWMLSSGEWHGRLLLEPKDAPLFIGESTGPSAKDGWLRRPGGGAARGGRAGGRGTAKR
jgi:DNA-binding LacI/PurR family transcriptional regulator